LGFKFLIAFQKFQTFEKLLKTTSSIEKPKKRICTRRQPHKTSRSEACVFVWHGGRFGFSGRATTSIKRPDSFVFAKLRNFKQYILQLINKNLSGLILLKIAF